MSRAPMLVAAASAATTVAISDSWRTALVAVLAAGAVVATRIRFSAYAAVAVLVLAAVAALAGWTATTDERPPEAPAERAS